MSEAEKADWEVQIASLQRKATMEKENRNFIGDINDFAFLPGG